MSKRKLIILVILILLWTMSHELWTPSAQASIVLKTLVVNPSESKTQKALLKAYLPEEVKPEDVVDLGDLEIDYDIEKALYYVYKEFELEPGESVSRSIEIKDVWLISRAQLDSLTGRTRELVEALKKTAYFDTALTLQSDIEEKSGEVLDKQEKALDALPQTHIAVYRENTAMLGSMKTMLAGLEKMFVESKIAAGAATEKISIKATWWVILGVIIALGLISFIFLIIWQRQANIVAIKQKTKESSQDEE